MIQPTSPILFAGTLTFGLILHQISQLDDGDRGVALINLSVIWCLFLIWCRASLKTLNFQWILLAGIALRVIGFCTEPFTSHDGLRYLADGAAILSDLNPLDTPYEAQPDAFQSRWPIFYEHRPYTTIYPPLALGLFSMAASTGPLYAWWSWKVMGCLTSIVLLFLFCRMSRADASYRPLAFWYALHPLVIIETSVAPHIDLFLLIPLGYWLQKAARGSGLQASLWLTIATLLKPTILLGGLAWLHDFSKRTLQIFLIVFGGLFSIFLTLRIIGVEAPLGADFTTFLTTWHFGSLLDTIVVWSDQPLHPFIRLGVWGLLSLIWLHQRGGESHFFQRFGDLLLIGLACSPVVFPWYLLILTVWLVHREIPIIIWWSTSLLTYEVLDSFDRTTSWAPSSWPNLLTVIILMLWALSRRTKWFMVGRPQ